MWLARVRQIGDYRIGDHIIQINSPNDLITKADVRVAHTVKNNPDAMLLKTIGIGNYSALAIAFMIGDT